MLKRWNFLKTGFYEGIKLLLAHRLSAATAVQDAFDGKIALTAVAAKALSRDEVWALKEAMNGYYGLAL